MIVDVHYHYVRLPVDEDRARNMARSFSLDAEKSGIKKSLDEVLSLYRDYMDDSNGDKLVRRMDESGIDITVVNVVDNIGYSQDNERVLRINENCAQLAAKHPGRIVALAGIDPRRADAPALFRCCIEEFNMKGLKWHPDDGYYPNSEASYAVLEVANELGVPLLTHTGPLADSRAKYAHPIHLDDIALDFPNVSIIAAHMGDIWWRDWAALAQSKKRICGDMAGWDLMAEGKPNLFRRYLREILDIVGPDQILFASVKQAWDLGAVAVGATIYFGAPESSRQIQEVSEAFDYAHQLGMATVLWCYLRNSAFKKDGVDYHVAADTTGQANHLGVTIQADIIKQKLPMQDGGYKAVSKEKPFGRYHEKMYTELCSEHPIDLCRYQVANNYMGRAGLINSGGASGANDFAEAAATAVINKRAGGMGLISGRKAFQRPMKEGVKLLNTIQDVYLCDEIDIA